MHPEEPLREAALEYEGPDSEERNLALLAHLSIFASGLVGPLAMIAPLVLYLQRREAGGFVAEEAREALNFQISMLILTVVSGLLTMVLIGIPMLIALVVLGIVLPILAAIRVSEGTPYRYPMTIRLVS